MVNNEPKIPAPKQILIDKISFEIFLGIDISIPNPTKTLKRKFYSFGFLKYKVFSSLTSTNFLPYHLIMMNQEAQDDFDKILAKLGKNEALAKYERSFFRARRYYLTPVQRIIYGDVLYFNKQFLLQRAKRIVIFMAGIIPKVVVGLIVYLIAQFISSKF